MSAQLIIVSGFLGAGKTSLIDQWLKTSLRGRSVALVENDFGERSLDARLLEQSTVTIRELSAGCICCSLSGDFIIALQKLLREQELEFVIIEPSGVSRLSDIVKACADLRIQALAKISRIVTLVDISKARRYAENFGDFFLDQIALADELVLTRSASEDTVSWLRGCNPAAKIMPSDDPDAWQWEDLTVRPFKPAAPPDAPLHFSTLSLELTRPWSQSALRQAFDKLSSLPGEVLRVKGVAPSDCGPLLVQFVPGELYLTATDLDLNGLFFIGQNLAAEEIAAIFR